MELYFVRHGQTDWNAQGKIQGSTDIPLNDTGREQAMEAQKKLNDVLFNHAISSPLVRAYETAQIILNDRPLEIITDDRLKERDFGECEGMGIEVFKNIDLWNFSDNYQPVGGESTIATFDRMEAVLKYLKNTYDKDDIILITSHGGLGIPFKCHFEGHPSDGDYRKLRLENCAILHYTL